MIITALIIFIFAILLLLLSRKDRFLFLFGIQAFCIVIMLFACVLIVAKQANYHSALTVDFMLYLQLHKLHISLGNIIRIFHVSCTVFITVCYFQSQLFCKNSILKTILCTIPALLTLILNDPELRYLIFIRIPGNFNMIYNTIYAFTAIIAICYSILPVTALLKMYIKTKIRINKQRALSLFFGLTAMISFFVFDFVIGANSFMYFISTIYFPDNIPDWNSYIYTPAILLVILTGYMFIIYRYNSMFLYRKKKITYTNDANSIKMLFHNYKNSFFIIERLAKQISRNITEKPLSVTHDASMIEEIAKDNSVAIAKIIESFKNDFLFNPNKINLSECVKKAVLKSNIPENIVITEYYESDNITIYGNEDSLCNGIINIINNAADSVSSNAAEKNISISVFTEEALCCIEVTDNGKGISKKDAKKIFSPFYSTKHGGKNNGIGLTYTKKIISEHQGKIDFESITGKYTSFQIVLPVNKK